ncbi:unnamed protein product [Cyclocybe aegerita]|uniref:Uncharacterized protein n=1 Tax=Cyclocybe aegerita TaxID=1973307 RepID=A0A8S0W4S5_CYCAE|nr:unnamed protein product [Cyclocybe aegerita]
MTTLKLPFLRDTMSSICQTKQKQAGGKRVLACPSLMSSLLPPTNQAGIPVPKTPQNPATFDDIGRAVLYLRALEWTRMGPHPNPATDREIGEAEVYKTALILSCMFGSQTAPPWLAGFRDHIQHVQALTNAGPRNDTNATRSTNDALRTDDGQQIPSRAENGGSSQGASGV